MKARPGLDSCLERRTVVKQADRSDRSKVSVDLGNTRGDSTVWLHTMKCQGKVHTMSTSAGSCAPKPATQQIAEGGSEGDQNAGQGLGSGTPCRARDEDLHDNPS